MEICKKCGGIAEWNSYYGGITCTRCGYVEKPIPTNYDLFISKTPEEIAKIVYSGCPPVDGCLDHDDYESPNCVGCWIDWLNTEANERML